jgi:hypothetical protein
MKQLRPFFITSCLSLIKYFVPQEVIVKFDFNFKKIFLIWLLSICGLNIFAQTTATNGIPVPFIDQETSGCGWSGTHFYGHTSAAMVLEMIFI